MSLDVMKQALEALENVYGKGKRCEAVITALRAAIEQAQDSETEAELYKRLYELRGKALERPCINCGHQPAKIKAMAQPEQKPVAWMHPSWIDPDTRGWSNNSFSAIPIEGWMPVYTAPRQWQGLTDEERTELLRLGLVGVEIVEAKLKEKNA